MATIKSTESDPQKKLSYKAVNALRYNTKAKNRLASLVNKSAFTIGVWIRSGNTRLVFEKAIEIIGEETGLSNDEILEFDSVSAK